MMRLDNTVDNWLCVFFYLHIIVCVNVVGLTTVYCHLLVTAIFFYIFARYSKTWTREKIPLEI